MMTLIEPSHEALPSYVAALRTGWSPSTTRDLSGEHLASIASDPAAFIADVGRTEGGTIEIDDGRVVPRLPQRVRWMWDCAFCGSINLRFQPGTLELPPHVSGHIGYAVVPWKRRLGYATRALALLLDDAHDLGLPRVLLTCDVGNVASRGVIEANGGVLAGEQADAEHGGMKYLFWIETRPG